jgi:hypothetical protein
VVFEFYKFLAPMHMTMGICGNECMEIFLSWNSNLRLEFKFCANQRCEVLDDCKHAFIRRNYVLYN